MSQRDWKRSGRQGTGWGEEGQGRDGLGGAWEVTSESPSISSGSPGVGSSLNGSVYGPGSS